MIKPPKPTPAPKVENKKLLIIPYTYALLLVFLVTLQLVRFDSFVPYVAGALGDQVNGGTTVMASIIIGVEVFALPFLLRLNLSPLARLCSALLVVATPIVWTFATLTPNPFMSAYTSMNFGFIVWGCLSFWVLNGKKALWPRLK